MEDSAPRVNFETMQRFIGSGKKVILACSIKQIENGRVLASTSDKGEVSIISSGTGGPYEGQFIEVVGTVVDPNTIQEAEHVNMGDAFDLNLYNELVKLTHREQYSGMFY